MFLHAESLQNETVLRDDQMVGFIRFGNDFTQNFYQIEIPLKVTAFSIIDIRLFSFECTGSVASRKRNRFALLTH
jgi:cell surface protein SprA